MIEIGSHDWDIEDLERTFGSKQTLSLTEETKQVIRANRQYLESKLTNSEHIFYGINTGFGSLCNVKIDHDQLSQLQVNLIRSHAAGSGPKIPTEIVRSMILLKIKSLSQGHSGATLNLVQALQTLYNKDIIPVVRKYGSLGASGDLAPLAHLSLSLIGEGEVIYKGRQRPTGEVFKELDIEPIQLQSKEGIALLNGTQFCCSYLLHIVSRAKALLHRANVISAMSLDAFQCLKSPFDHKIQEVRRHQGQIEVAGEIRAMLDDSTIWQSSKNHVQDPYSFRCIPQVHGASYQAIKHAEDVLNQEINAVTDNPLIFEEEDDILSGGNFHAQSLAISLDYLAIGIAELASISERRIYKFLNGLRGLPAYLSSGSGLNSGFMIAQYTAASIVSHNKQLCTPNSVDSIVSSNGQEDHVSMGANAATSCFEVLENAERVLSIELMLAAQALDFRRPEKSSPQIEALHKAYRKEVSFLKEDRQLSIDMDTSLEFLKRWDVGI